jgi:hypothetical protein
MKKTDVSLIPQDFTIRSAYAVGAADRLIKLKQENKVWESIEEIVKIWADSKPHEYQSYVLDITEIKETMYDPKFGTTREKGSNLRRYLDIPDTVMKMIRLLYNPDELPMNKDFFIKWGKRFPRMMTVQKI